MESITLIEAVVPERLFTLPKNPAPACHGKQLKLHDQGSAVFVAHKQMFSAKSELT
jgi:hypothetical protein